MHQFKFRCFDKKDGSYFFALTDFMFEVSPQGIYNATFLGMFGDSLTMKGEDLIVELSTNKFDKKGKEIFEGDILAVPGGWSGDYQGRDHLSAVTWDDDYRSVGFDVDFDDDVTWEDCTIVGNVNQNPLMIAYEEALAQLNKIY